VSTRKGTDICEFAQPGSYTKVSMTWYMHACEYMYSTYTKRFKVWALARAQTHVSLHNTGSSHKSIYDLWSHICKFVNLCVRIQRGSKCEHPPGDKQYYANLHNLGSYTKVSIIWCIYVYVWILVNICMHTKRLQVWVCTRAGAYVGITTFT